MRPAPTSAHPVLLIHGIDDTEALFQPLRAVLEDQGLTVHTINLTPNDGSVGLDRLAEQVLHFANTHLGLEGSFDLVGFSMGGLVARYYLQRLGGLERVRRFITISSPHRGTWTAFLRSNAGARQMRPRSSFLEDLNRDAATLQRVAHLSVWTSLDLMILPANSSRLPASRSLCIRVAAHPLMLRSARVSRSVLEALSG